MSRDKANSSSSSDLSIDQIPVESRRLDSIAWIIQGDGVCGAACLVDGKLLLSTNDNDNQIPSDTINHLKKVAISAKQMQEIFNNPELSETKKESEISTLRNEITNSTKSLISNLKSKSNLYNTSSTFSQTVNQSIEKVNDSIIASYIDPKSTTAISPELRHAISCDDGVEIVLGNKNVHAEMKLTQKLFDSGKLDQKGFSIYLGISKRCCLNCEHAINAVNTVKSQGREEGKVLVIDARKPGSSIPFPAGIPEFLEKDVEVQKEFLRTRKKSNLENIFKEKPDRANTDIRLQLHSRSSSRHNTFETLDRKFTIKSISRVKREVVHRSRSRDRDADRGREEDRYRDRDVDRGRDSRDRYRDRDRDGRDADRGRDRDSRDRYRDRDRDGRDADRGRDSRDRYRDRDADRGRDGRDRYRDRDADRGRDGRDRYRDRDADRGRDRDADRGRDGRDRYRDSRDSSARGGNLGFLDYMKSNTKVEINPTNPSPEGIGLSKKNMEKSISRR